MKIEHDLPSWATPVERDETPGAVQTALIYIENRRDRVGFATPEAGVLRMARGSGGANCESIITVRVKRAGARRRPHRAPAMFDLRALAPSSRWDDDFRRLDARWPKDLRAVD